jgi:ATP-binding protein involved in chromosome partitioning
VPTPSEQDIRQALATVIDPEIRRPITDLDMVESIEVGEAGAVTVSILLTVPGCPLKDQLERDVKMALASLGGVGLVTVKMGTMSEEQRHALQVKLRGPEVAIQFNDPASKTRVIAIASGKGGVGKSSVTANLAVALAAQGLAVGVLDADIYGFSMPRMLGVIDEPTQMEEMILPPVSHGVKVFSIGMLVPPGQPVVWRGPVLHRAIQQFLTDVYWGDLDVLLADLPPGTGDVALSIAKLLPSSELILVTTPQPAAAEVAQRAGALALQTHQPIVGVVENMSGLPQPDGSVLPLFGEGGGQQVADNLAGAIGGPVPLLGRIPLDIALREGGDTGEPVVVSRPDTPAAAAFRAIAAAVTGRGLPA